MNQNDGARPLDRRGFLRGAAAVIGVATAAPLLDSAVALAVAQTPDAAAGAQNWWLGAELWGNRTEDWALRSNKITCVASAGKQLLCTASLLTRSLDGRKARLRVVTGTQTTGGGFSGFLIGSGEPSGDYRRTALVHAFSGTGGGLFAVLDSDGVARFREHTDEVNQTAFAEIASVPSGPRPPRTLAERVTLILDIAPTQPGRVSLNLTAYDASGAPQASAWLSDIDASAVIGGTALVSSGRGSTGATYWFNRPQVTGAGVVIHPERALGPIVGTLFSVAGGTLKMTAQLAPFAVQASDRVTLESLGSNGAWSVRATSPVGLGFAALLRVTGWDTAQTTQYRVTHNRAGGLWAGRIPAEPTEGPALKIATISCSKAAHRGTDRRTPLDAGLSGGKPLPLYFAANMYFPYEPTMQAVAVQQPDMLVAMGDQYYDGAPTKTDPASAPDMDFYYRYVQWLWAVRELTRNLPTLVLVDDHDVFQGNLWGEGGAPTGASGSGGGYDRNPAWINMVQRVQCGHNPDPYDPEPVGQGITVYFTRFDYAGVTMALVEDRKFKTGPQGTPGVPPADYDLLGERQEAMLASLAGSSNPVVVLTQTMYACVETDRYGVIAKTKDSGGYPKVGRDRALSLIKRAGGVLLSGDTHLAALVRHGAQPADGPVQFCGPAVASSYTRWFQPAAPLPDPAGQPYTGQARDGLGNDYRVLAVANPRITQDEAVRRGGDLNIGDRTLRYEGYGMLIVNRADRSYRFEAWEGDVDPTAPGAGPMPGWPYTLPFEDA